MFVNEKILQQGNEPGALFAYFHAQRTGGSAFQRWLRLNFPKEQIFSSRTVGNFTHWRKTDAETLKPFRLFAGFSQFEEKKLDRPLVCLSIVRHPFFRIVSLYEMSRRDESHYRHQQALRTTFEEYYREVDAEEPSYLRNLCCRRIGNSYEVDAAKEAMHRQFGAVGTTDHLREMTALLGEFFAWPAPPLEAIMSDDEKYAGYLSSPVHDDILEKSAGDVALYEYVRDAGNASPVQEKTAQSVPIALSPQADIAADPDLPRCIICNTGLRDLGEKGACPVCNSRARTRSLVTVLDYVIKAHTGGAANAKLPLLAFAMTELEKKLLAPYFASFESVSLYGKYGLEHTTDLDVRDLSRYPDESFSGAFGILLFDYFVEQEKALAELYRVITPGGILFTLILPSRVLADRSEPAVAREIKTRPGYFDYVPEGGTLLHVKVGQEWFLSAMDKAGFKPFQMRVPDPATAHTSQWFIGIKPASASLETDESDMPPALPEPPPPAAPLPESPQSASVTHETRTTKEFSQEFVCPLQDIPGLRKIAVRLTIPAVPMAGRTTDFAEHQWIAAEGRSGSQITCVGIGQIMTSQDMGRSWDIAEPPELSGKRIINHFTTAAGNRIVQLPGWAGYKQEDRDAADWGALYRLDPGLGVIGKTRNSDARWHGPRAIGEQNGVILYSDYFENPLIYRTAQHSEEWNNNLRANHVWRSGDDGQSWQRIFTQEPTEIRHFHFVIADPFTPRRWWLSSGDRPKECFIWRSDDDGETWQDVTNPEPDIALHPMAQNYARAAFRSTDLVVLPDKLIWATDDILVAHEHFDPALVPPMRARIYAAQKSDMLQPVELGIGGQSFRNLVDVGPGYLAFSEAKFAQLSFEPKVFFVEKAAPHRVQFLFSIPNARKAGTGFSYSRASRAALDGRFFSFRGAGDLANQLPRLLQWDVAFE